jgi:hypothetical protein
MVWIGLPRPRSPLRGPSLFSSTARENTRPVLASSAAAARLASSM